MEHHNGVARVWCDGGGSTNQGAETFWVKYRLPTVVQPRCVVVSGPPKIHFVVSNTQTFGLVCDL